MVDDDLLVVEAPWARDNRAEQVVARLLSEQITLAVAAEGWRVVQRKSRCGDQGAGVAELGPGEPVRLGAEPERCLGSRQSLRPSVALLIDSAARLSLSHALR